MCCHNVVLYENKDNKAFGEYSNWNVGLMVQNWERQLVQECQHYIILYIVYYIFNIQHVLFSSVHKTCIITESY